MAPDPTEVRQRLPNSTVDSESLELPSNSKGRKLVGIDGKWYDVTDFLPLHPGGPVLEHYVGRDATQVFHAQGHGNVLKYRKPVGTYTPRERHPADKDFDKLRDFFHANGYYKTDVAWYSKKISVVFLLFICVFACVMLFDSWYMHYLGAVCLAFMWQQSGFIMHDVMHSQMFRNTFKDQCAGLFFGSFFFGFSAHWWQDEHIVHHALTNTVDSASRFADPQMWEDVWAQNEILFPLFSGFIAKLFIKVQHITFVPFVVCVGRFTIMVESYVAERRWYEFAALLCHWVWMVYLLSHLPTWREVAIFYVIAAWMEGIFHFQLILSHYCKSFQTITDYHKNSWYLYQILSNMNIDCPVWMDWCYGGLNFHIEHHLYPKIARNKLRSASKYVRQVCEKHNIDYDSSSFSHALSKTLSHLKRVGHHYTLASIDPR